MKRHMAVLNNTELFSEMSEEEIKGILICLNATVKDFQKEETVLHMGDTIGCMGVLLFGEVLILQEDFWGNRNLMARVTPGQIFGEAFACAPGAVLTVSAVANKASSVLWLDVQRILTTCSASCVYHNRMIQNLLSDMAQKNLRLNEKLTHMGQRGTRQKLLSYLSAQARRQGTAVFEIPFNRQQLADYLSVERSAMSAELSKLRDEGILEFDKSLFKLKQNHQ